MARIKPVEIHADDGLEIHADAAIVAGLAGPGFAVVPGFLQEPAVAALRDRALALDRDGALTAAAVGRGPARGARPEIRGDRTHWLDGAAPAEVALLARFESLRRAVNEALFLGLVELEAHYALYPPGAAYARHRDRFRDDDARVLSCVLYLNHGWVAADGGALRLYLASDATLDVAPEGGTLVCFLAARFDHEVLPARRPRLSIAGWFRQPPQTGSGRNTFAPDRTPVE
jgi:SM-20-related protein